MQLSRVYKIMPVNSYFFGRWKEIKFYQLKAFALAKNKEEATHYLQVITPEKVKFTYVKERWEN